MGNQSVLNTVVSNQLREGGDELRDDGIRTETSLEESRAFQSIIAAGPVVFLREDDPGPDGDDDGEVQEEIIEQEILDDIIDDIDLDIFYEMDETYEIEMDEFVDLLKISGIFLQEKEIKKIFDALDKNANGKLYFDEITKFIDFMRIKKRNKKRNKKTQEIELTK